MSSLLRSFLMVLFAAFVLWCMARFELIDLALIRLAFTQRWSMVMTSFLLQCAAFVVLMFRYVMCVRAFDVRPRLKDMMAATFVSVALGQWAPGAIAVMELLRLGLMFGSDPDGAALATLRPRLLAASLYDRVIGFAVMLFFGFLTSLGLLMRASESSGLAPMALGLLCAFSALGTLGLVSLPFLARLGITTRILKGLHKAISHASPSKARRIALRLLDHAESLRHVLATGGTNLVRFVGPAITSAVAFFLMAGATWSASLAIGTEIPFAAICAAIPIMSLAALLPLGLGGVGGYQLVSVAVFQIFGVETQVASGANLLQNALALLGSTLLGLIFARSSMEQIRRILFKHPKAANAVQA